MEESDGDKLIQTGYSTPNLTPRSVYSSDRPYKKPEFKPKVVYENGECVFSTLRQKLLQKPLQRKLKKGERANTELEWHEPFVLYYDDEKCQKMAKETDENNMRFTIDFYFETEGTKKQKA